VQGFFVVATLPDRVGAVNIVVFIAMVPGAWAAARALRAGAVERRHKLTGFPKPRAAGDVVDASRRPVQVVWRPRTARILPQRLSNSIRLTFRTQMEIVHVVGQQP